MGNLNEVKSQVVTRDANGIPPIIKLLSHKDIEISRRAARCLGAVAQNNRKIQIARKSKAVDTVVKMLAHSNEEVRKSAAGAVAALAENDFSNQIAIRKC